MDPAPQAKPESEAPPADQAGGYPPPGHFLRHLRLSVDPREEGRIDGTMPVLDDLCDQTGAVRLGPMATLVDFALGVLSTHAAAPDWIATHDLGIQLLEPVRDGDVHLAGRIVRSGRNTVVSESVLRDDDERVVAAATTTYSRLSRKGPSGPTAPLRGVIDLAEDDEARRTTLDRYLGFEIDADSAPGTGTLSFEHLPHLRNSTGAIQGGMITVAMEWLAAELAGRAVGRPAAGRTTQLQVYYLSQGRQPPFEVRGRCLGRDPGPLGESLHRLELIEVPTGKLLALGTARATG